MAEGLRLRPIRCHIRMPAGPTPPRRIDIGTDQQRGGRRVEQGIVDAQSCVAFERLWPIRPQALDSRARMHHPQRVDPAPLSRDGRFAIAPI
ncbi:hypothetical protein [Sphingomonas sanxanigenens]|uniref:hypothetical protein n=1 Tax=Sphingomonas sanxanigenens TaxID=397260 RepID=UPI00138F15D7|nr:hypothetical protein [Sphingomonas sanxanigenens]